VKLTEGAKSKIEPFRQASGVSAEFNQDLNFSDDVNQDNPGLDVGSRVRHPAFGEGKVVNRRGDVVTIQFDSGQKKTFALSIAPLQVL
jgi:hypothetical protein